MKGHEDLTLKTFVPRSKAFHHVGARRFLGKDSCSDHLRSSPKFYVPPVPYVVKAFDLGRQTGGRLLDVTSIEDTRGHGRPYDRPRCRHRARIELAFGLPCYWAWLSHHDVQRFDSWSRWPPVSPSPLRQPRKPASILVRIDFRRRRTSNWADARRLKFGRSCRFHAIDRQTATSSGSARAWWPRYRPDCGSRSSDTRFRSSIAKRSMRLRFPADRFS